LLLVRQGAGVIVIELRAWHVGKWDEEPDAWGERIVVLFRLEGGAVKSAEMMCKWSILRAEERKGGKEKRRVWTPLMVRHGIQHQTSRMNPSRASISRSISRRTRAASSTNPRNVENAAAAVCGRIVNVIVISSAAKASSVNPQAALCGRAAEKRAKTGQVSNRRYHCRFVCRAGEADLLELPVLLRAGPPNAASE
jgi:hypothetical protein